MTPEASRSEKLEMVKSLCWDYEVDPEDMLDVVEGNKESAGPFNAVRLFIRSLERMAWHRIIALWGIERMMSLYTDEVAHSLWPASLRRRYDFAFGVLRGEPVSPAGWSPELRRKMQSTLLSHRWYRTQQGVL